MIDFLSEYGLFLAKTLTFIFAFLVVAFTIFALAHKEKSSEGSLVVTHLNKQVSEIKEILQQEMLSKSALKAWNKSIKLAEKEKKKLEKSEENQGRLFVVRFDGDIRASQTEALRECVSAIISVARPDDEVLIVLESAGGIVQNYGLAASQL